MKERPMSESIARNSSEYLSLLILKRESSYYPFVFLNMLLFIWSILLDNWFLAAISVLFAGVMLFFFLRDRFPTVAISGGVMQSDLSPLDPVKIIVAHRWGKGILYGEYLLIFHEKEKIDIKKENFGARLEFSPKEKRREFNYSSEGLGKVIGFALGDGHGKLYYSKTVPRKIRNTWLKRVIKNLKRRRLAMGGME
jgi:hypothetical protein